MIEKIVIPKKLKVSNNTVIASCRGGPLWPPEGSGPAQGPAPTIKGTTSPRNDDAKAIAFTVLCTFFNLVVFQFYGAPTAHADFEVFGLDNKILPNVLVQSEKALNVSPEYGVIIERSSTASDQRPRVVLVMDAHANSNAQTNIANVIDELTKTHDGSTSVLIEGARGRVDASLLGFYPDIAIRDRVANELLIKMEINAAEYFQATHPERAIEINGIEDPQLYRRNLSADRALGEEREKALESVTVFSRELEQLAKTMFPSSLQTLLKQREDAYAGRTEHWRAYLDLLLNSELTKNVDLSRFPKVLELKKQLYDPPQTSEPSFDSNLFTQQILEEIELLETEMLANLLDSFERKQLYHHLKHLKLWKKMLRLELSPRDVDYLKSNRDKFAWSHTAEFIKLHRPQAELPYDSSKQILVKILDFYETAQLRDHALAERILVKLSQSSNEFAIAVVGGFHREGLSRHLREKGISYEVIQPKIEEGSNNSFYHQKLDALKPLDTFAPAAQFDLDPFVDVRPFLHREVVLALLRRQVATDHVDLPTAARGYQTLYRDAIGRTVHEPSLRKKLLRRADTAFSNILEELRDHNTTAQLEVGFGAKNNLTSDNQASFEIKKLRQVIAAGGNNIIFFGGAPDVNESLIKPIKSALEKKQVGLGNLQAVNVFDARQIQELLEEIDESLSTRPERWQLIRSVITGTIHHRVFIIKNFHLLDEHLEVQRKLLEALKEGGHFVIGIVPGENSERYRDYFHRVEATWGGEYPLTYSHRMPSRHSKKFKEHRSRKLLVIGASRGPGRAIYDKLKNEGRNVTGTYNATEPLDKANGQWYKLDAKDSTALKALVEKGQYDDIYYVAGDVNIDRLQQEANQKEAYQLHAETLKALKDYFAKRDEEHAANDRIPARLIYISTDAVFPGDLKESDPKYLTSSPTHAPTRGDQVQIYGDSKITGEEIVKSLTKHHLIVRLNYLVGFSHPQDEVTVDRRIVGAIDTSLVKPAEVLPLDNKRIRYPLLLTDAADSIDRLLANQLYGTFNLSGTNGVTQFGLAMRVVEQFARMFPFVSFERSVPQLKGVFTPKSTSTLAAPRAMNAAMVSSDLVSSTTEIAQSLIRELSQAGRGSGRSIVLRGGGKVIKISKADERGRKKLEDESAWLEAAASVPEIAAHTAELIEKVKVSNQGTLQLIVRDYPYEPISELFLNNPWAYNLAGHRLLTAYAFLAKELHARPPLKSIAPRDILRKHHLDRLQDRIKELWEKVDPNSRSSVTLSPEDVQFMRKLLQQETVEVNGTTYPNLPKLIQKLNEQLNNHFFNLVLTPPQSAIGMIHGDPHLANILFKDRARFRWIDPRGIDGDYLYDVAKILHDFSGKFLLFNNDLFELERHGGQDGQLVGMTYRFDTGQNAYQTLRRIERNGLGKLLLKTVLPKEKLAQDPYWYIRLVFTHAAHIASIPPFQVRHNDLDTALAVYGHAIKLMDEFFKLFEAWKEGNLKGFMEEYGENSRYLGFSYEDLNEAGFMVGGPQTSRGFGANLEDERAVYTEEIRRYATEARLEGSDTPEIKVEDLIARFEQDLSKLRSLPKDISLNAPRLIVTDENHLPQSRHALLSHLRSGLDITFTFQGSQEAAAQFLSDQFQITELPAGLEVISYGEPRTLYQHVSSFIHSEFLGGLELEHVVAYFGSDRQPLLRKLPDKLLRVHATEGSISLIDWDVINALAQVGPDHPAVRPLIVPMNDRGLLRIISWSEYLHSAMATEEAVETAA